MSLMYVKLTWSTVRDTANGVIRISMVFGAKNPNCRTDLLRVKAMFRWGTGGTPRFDFRAKHPELDTWGVITFGWKPIGERGKKEAKKTPWERQQEVERFKELFE